MNARLIERIETGAERVAAGLFGAAVGYAAYTWLAASSFEPWLGAYVAAATVAAFLLCSTVLERVAGGQSRFRVPVFDLREFDTLESGELLLTDKVDGELLLTEADRLAPSMSVDPLLLDDVLTEIGPDARVVRLFDRTAMPTPGELRTRIDAHIGHAPVADAPADASQALSEALAEQKRSLR
jgi:hypothetical protein